MKIKNELLSVNMALCLLITIGVFPLLCWHSWHALSGLARLSLLGFAIADLALWTSARWAAQGPTPLIRGASLLAKALLSVLLIVCAASVLAIHSSEKTASDAQEKQAQLERERLATVATQAERLAAVAGRSVAREFVAAARPAPSSLPSSVSPDSWRDLLPSWWVPFGVIAAPPMAGLLVLLLLGAMISLSPSPDVESHAIEEARPSASVRLMAPRAQYEQIDRPGAETASGGPRVQLERKPTGRIEAWLSDPNTKRGKTYLTSFSARLSPEEQDGRIQAALSKKVS